MEITDDSAMGIWKKALDYINAKGKDYKDNDGRTCRETFNLVLILKNAENADIEKPMDRMARTKSWIYPSREELSGIMFKKFPAPIYNFTYGGRIFNFGGSVNQLNEFIIPLLKQDSRTKRAIMVLYNPVMDSDINNRSTPGIIYIHFRIRDRKLHLTAAIRSNDLFFGWPANVYQFFNLLKTVSGELSVDIGDITVFSNSAHFFVEDLEYMESLLGEKDD